MIAIDAEHLKKWILARWQDNGGKDNDAPTTEEILAQIDREIRYMSVILEGPRWIPVSERLPKVDEQVLATTAWDDVTIAWRIGIDKWFIHEGETNATTEDLSAWMPLPAPYKEDEK